MLDELDTETSAVQDKLNYITKATEELVKQSGKRAWLLRVLPADETLAWLAGGCKMFLVLIFLTGILLVLTVMVMWD
jgi:hypothetical protein